MLKAVLNLAARIAAGETGKSVEAPDTAIPHTRKAGSTEQTHPRNIKTLSKSDSQSNKELQNSTKQKQPVDQSK